MISVLRSGIGGSERSQALALLKSDTHMMFWLCGSPATADGAEFGKKPRFIGGAKGEVFLFEDGEIPITTSHVRLSQAV